MKTTTQTLFTPEELAEAQHGGDIVAIDTRDPEAYRAGHIPGAVNIREIFTALSDSTPDALRSLQTKFAELFGRVGLSGKETAVIYEDAMSSGYGQSCRGYFLLTYLGYPRAAILHGGLKAWTQAGLPLSTVEPTPTPKEFPLAVTPGVMVSRDEVLRALSDPGVVLLDVRDRDEWMGKSSSPYGVDFCPRKGRIPGAVWIEWTQMMETRQGLPMFRPAEQVLSICREVGISRDSSVYIYCFKGARASNTLVAMKQAGIHDVKIYFASWNEWSRDLSLPIEEGPPATAHRSAQA